MEEQYHRKNIRFISIWVEPQKRPGASGNKYELDGEQSLNKEGKILDVLQIQSIPRFLFYDPKGNWLSMDAPEPMMAVDSLAHYTKLKN